MVIRDLLDAAKQFSSKQIEYKNSVRGLKSSFREFIKDFRKSVTKRDVAECQKAVAQVLGVIEVLNGMKDGVLENNKEIEDVMEILEKLRLSNESTLSTIEHNIEMLRESFETLLQEEDRIKAIDCKLAMSTDFSSAGVVVDEAERISKYAMEKAKTIKDLLQKSERGRDAMMEKFATMKGMLAIITENMERRIEEHSPVNITVHDLRSSNGPLHGNVERDIFVVSLREGKQKVAPIKVHSKNLISVNHLEDVIIPPASFVLQLESLMLNKSSRRVFLDLAVREKHLGRIIIKVMDEGNLALNFLHMCMGDLGPSYANSHVVCVDEKGKAGENIEFGQYEVEGGTSMKAVLSGVDWKKEKMRGIYQETALKPGDVRGWFLYEKASQFDIVIREHAIMMDKDCFGKVEEGLDILRDAIRRYPDIRRVKVVECGLLFSL
ncbi:uncharacterized protein [Palaemon carinicauda]